MVVGAAVNPHTMVRGRRSLLGVGALLFASSPARGQIATPASSLLPEDQRAFAAAIDSAWQATKPEKDNERRAEIFARRSRDLRAALSGALTFERWVCTVTYVAFLRETTLIALKVLGSRGSSSGTIGNFSFNTESDVRLAPGTSMAMQARDFRLDERLSVSGAFKADPQRGCATAYGRQASTTNVEFEIPLFTVQYLELIRLTERRS
jgi:hypothetical protein